MDQSPASSSPPQQHEEPPKDPALKGVVGIQNMGNTCYCNSTLQLIRASPEWNAFCLTQNFIEQLKNVPEENTYKRILLAYQDILKSLWSAYKPAYVRPLGFISEVRKAVKGTVYEMFGIPVPNDSHEYLVYLLDSFHEAIKTERPYVEKTIPVNAGVEEAMQIMAENGINAGANGAGGGPNTVNPLLNTLLGGLFGDILGGAAGGANLNLNAFLDTRVPVFPTADQINNATTVYRVNRHLAKIYSHIWHLPQSLFVTLRRFNWDGHKNMVACPYEGANISFTEFFARESDHPSRRWLYELRGVSDHHGSHMGGHYTAQFKHPISGDWWWFDDESAQQLEKPRFSASNYIFYFRRC